MTATFSLLAAFLRRDATVQASYRADLLLQLATIFFTLALFFYLGKLVDDAELASEDGFEQGYFAFVVIGIALIRILQTGLTSFSNRLRQEQTTGTLEALVSTPARPSVIILFSAAFDLVRATLLALVLVLGASLFFDLTLEAGAADLVVAWIALFACVAVFAAAGVVLAAFTIVYKQTTAALALVVSGLALLGGVYFPLDLLPDPLQTIGEALPFTWGLDVLRSALLAGDVDGTRLILLIASAAALLPASLAVVNAALQRARRDGSLAQY